MANQLSELFVRISADIESLDKEFRKASSKVNAFAGDMKRAGGLLTAGITVPILAVGGAAIKAGLQFDEAMDQIRAGTGATGVVLKGLGDDLRAVFARVPASLENTTLALTELSQRTGLTGTQLQDLTVQVLELSRLTGSDLSATIRGVTRVFGDWDIAVHRQSATLDSFFKISQQTGISVDQLAETIVTFGAPLRQMGFSFDEAAATIGLFEREGVRTELVMGSLRIALGKMAKAGLEPTEVFRQMVETIKTTGSASEATGLAIKLFGARAGPDMAAAIREGRFEVGELMDAVRASSETVLAAAEDTKSLNERMAQLRNQALLAIEPIGTQLVGAIEDLLPVMVKLLSGLATLVGWFTKLPGPVTAAGMMIAGLFAIIGPSLYLLGGMATGLTAIAAALARISATAPGAATGLRAVGIASNGASIGLTGTAVGAARFAGIIPGLLRQIPLLAAAYIALDAAQSPGGMGGRVRGSISQIDEVTGVADLRRQRAAIQSRQQVIGATPAVVKALTDVEQVIAEIEEASRRAMDASGNLFDKLGTGARAARPAVDEVAKAQEEARKAAEAHGKVVTDIHGRLNAQVAVLKGNTIAMREYELQQQGLTATEIAAILIKEKYITALETRLERELEGGRALGEAVEEYGRKIEEANQRMQDAMLDVLDNLSGGFFGRMKGMWGDLSTAVGRYLGPEAEGLMGKVGAFATSLLEMAGPAGIAFKAISAIGNLFGINLSGIIKDTLGKAWNAVTGFFKDMLGLGGPSESYKRAEQKVQNLPEAWREAFKAVEQFGDLSILGPGEDWRAIAEIAQRFFEGGKSIEDFLEFFGVTPEDMRTVWDDLEDIFNPSGQMAPATNAAIRTAAASGTSGTITIPLYVDGREIARATAPHMVDEARMKGAIRNA